MLFINNEKNNVKGKKIEKEKDTFTSRFGEKGFNKFAIN